MNFFNATDWFGREGNFLFSPEHIIFIVLATALGILLPLMLRKKSTKTIKGVLIGLWVFALVFDLLKWGNIWICDITGADTFKLASHLPLHFCSMFLYVAPIALFAKNQKLKTAATNFVCTVSMLMGYMSLFLSTAMMSSYSLFSFNGMHTMVYHAILFIFPMTMLLTRFYKPKWKDMLGGIVVVLIICAIMITFDNIFAVDYMYLYDESTLGVFHFISQNVPRVVWIVIAVLGYVASVALIHSIVMGILALCKKKSEK